MDSKIKMRDQWSKEMQEQWETSAFVIAFHWVVAVPLFFILFPAKDALWTSAMFVGISIAILAAAWGIIKFKSEQPPGEEEKPHPLVMIKRWERKLDAQLCVKDGEEGFSLTRIEARDDGWSHEDMFLGWSDGTTTVMRPDQWTLDMANALDVLRRKGRRFKKIGQLLGPPLTREEFEADCVKLFGWNPDEIDAAQKSP